MDETQTSGTSGEEEQRGRKRMAIIQAETSSAEPLSDRDRIAEKAMQAYLLEYGIRDYATIAEWSYKMADAMLAERTRAHRPPGDAPKP